jgi:hypothetical protein
MSLNLISCTSQISKEATEPQEKAKSIGIKMKVMQMGDQK